MTHHRKGRRYYMPRWMKELIFVEQAGKCHYCGRQCQPTDGKIMEIEEQPDDLFTIDHITPVRLGGSSRRSNLIGSCKACNAKKGGGTISELKSGVSVPWRPRRAPQQVKKAPHQVKVGAFYGPRRLIPIRITRTTVLERAILWIRRAFGLRRRLPDSRTRRARV